MGVLNVLWVLLSISLFVSLLSGLFSGFRSLRNQFGIVGLFLPLLLLAVMCQSYSTNQRLSDNGKIKKFEKIAVQSGLPDSLRLKHYARTLDDHTSFAVEQDIFLSRLHQSDSIQVTTYSSLYGFIMGITWLPTDTDVSFLSNRQLHYHTIGTLEWHLLGVPIFRRHKQFDGMVHL